MKVYSLEVEVSTGFDFPETIWILGGVYATKEDAKDDYLYTVKDKQNAIDWDVKEWNV